MVQHNCSCGATVKYAGPAQTMFEVIDGLWQEWHGGPGHDPVTADEANRTRDTRKRVDGVVTV